MKTSRFARHGLAAACAVCCASTFAQTTTIPELKPVIVTANRVETRADELVSEVVVISREQIERSSGLSLPEMLARQAGVQMTANGGLGKNSSIFIRGTESRHTLLLIDGVRYGSATTGAPSWDNIPLDMIERIEVLKGPASSIYGSEAVGGVVQIFMKQGSKGFKPSASVTLGSRSYAQVAANLSGGTEDLTYQVGLQHTKDGGFSATNSAVAFGGFNADDDNFRQTAFNGGLKLKLNAQWAIDARVLSSSGFSRFDSGPTLDARSDADTKLYAVGVQGQVLPAWNTRLSYSSSEDKSVSLHTVSTFATTQKQLGWKNDVKTPIGIVVAGVEQLKQTVDSTTVYTVNARTINSLYAGLNGSAGAHSWQVNLRRDRNSQFGANSTGFAGYGFAISPQWRVHASHGTSFVAPSFNQLYFPNFGNALLQPEKGRNTDVGVTFSQGGHSVKLVHFDNKIRGFITNTTLAANIPRARIDGWTLGYDGQIGAWRLNASVDSLDPRNEVTGKLLPRRSKNQLQLGAGYSAGAWSAGADVLKVGSRFDNATNTAAATLPGYTTLDLHAKYLVTKDWAIEGKINNLTDRQYETAQGFNQPGRGVFVSLRYSPK